MTKPTYILIRESSNESGYTAHSFPTETSAYTAMDCMVESDAAAIETTYRLSPRVEQVSSYKTQLIFDAIIAESDMTVKITYSDYVQRLCNRKVNLLIENIKKWGTIFHLDCSPCYAFVPRLARSGAFFILFYADFL